MSLTVKAAINPPSLAISSMDYQTECQFALEPSVRGLLDKAVEAGWSRDQAATAIFALVFDSIDDPTPAIMVSSHRDRGIRAR